MTLIAWGLILAVVLPVLFLVWTFATSDRRTMAVIHTNLAQGFDTSAAVASDRPSPLIGVAKKLTPDAYIRKLDRILALAGRPASMPLERFLVAKPLLALGGALFGLLMFSSAPGVKGLLLALFITALCYFLPDLLMYNKATKRQQAIELELPNTLDQMLISVEAGLGFETAMARAGMNGKGPLAEEIVRTLQDMQVGRPRREAYRSLADRSSVQDLKSFVRAVIQADKYGIGIATVLKTQAQQSRVKRRQRAEEKAMKLPVKVLFPLLLFIFPVLFIVLLGPAAINAIAVFS